MAMITIRDVGDATLYVGGIAGALAAIGLLVRYTVVRPLKTWISTAAAPARQALDQVKPNGGSQESTRHIIENTADQVAGMTSRLETMALSIDHNREIAAAALALARETSARLDTHLIRGHDREEHHDVD